MVDRETATPVPGSLTPEQRAANVGLFWIELDEPVKVNALPDWGLNGQAIVKAIREAESAMKERCIAEAIKAVKFHYDYSGAEVEAAIRSLP